MKKILCLSLIFLLAAAILTGCTSVSADKIYGKNDKDITVNSGQAFTIHLEENPTTGYEWTVSISDKKTVAFISGEYRQGSGVEGIVSSGGVKILTFKGLEKGNAAVTLVYERSFERNSAAETIVYNVTVK